MDKFRRFQIFPGDFLLTLPEATERACYGSYGEGLKPEPSGMGKIDKMSLDAPNFSYLAYALEYKELVHGVKAKNRTGGPILFKFRPYFWDDDTLG